MDYDKPHLTPNEKTQPMQWTELANWCMADYWFTVAVLLYWLRSFPLACLIFSIRRWGRGT